MTISPLPGLTAPPGLPSLPGLGNAAGQGPGGTGFAALVQLLLADTAAGTTAGAQPTVADEDPAETAPDAETTSAMAALVVSPTLTAQAPVPVPVPPAVSATVTTDTTTDITTGIPTDITRGEPATAGEIPVDAHPDVPRAGVLAGAPATSSPAAAPPPATPQPPQPQPQPTTLQSLSGLAGLSGLSGTPGTAPVEAPSSGAAAAAPTATHQVAAELLRLAESGPRHDVTRHVTLQLNPEALGEVRVTLSLHAGGVRVRLAADAGLTREALAAGIPQLQQLLGEHAVSTDRADRAGRTAPAVEVVVVPLPSDARTDTGSHTGSRTGADESHSGASTREHATGDGFAQPHEQRPARMPVGHTATDGPRTTADLPPVDDLLTSGSLGRLDVSV